MLFSLLKNLTNVATKYEFACPDTDVAVLNQNLAEYRRQLASSNCRFQQLPESSQIDMFIGQLPEQLKDKMQELGVFIAKTKEHGQPVWVANYMLKRYLIGSGIEQIGSISDYLPSPLPAENCKLVLKVALGRWLNRLGEVMCEKCLQLASSDGDISNTILLLAHIEYFEKGWFMNSDTVEAASDTDLLIETYAKMGLATADEQLGTLIETKPRDFDVQQQFVKNMMQKELHLFLDLVDIFFNKGHAATTRIWDVKLVAAITEDDASALNQVCQIISGIYGIESEYARKALLDQSGRCPAFSYINKIIDQLLSARRELSNRSAKHHPLP